MDVIAQSGISPLWIWDLNGGTRTQISASNQFAEAPVWSHDGGTIYFDIFGTEVRDELHLVAVDGSQPERTLIKSDRDLMPTVTNEGKWLLYEEAVPGSFIPSPPGMCLARTGYNLCHVVPFYAHGR
jgi:Tol biopolymer transport system component